MADEEIEALMTLKRQLIAELSKRRDELQKEEKRPRRDRSVALTHVFQQSLDNLYDQKDDAKSNKKSITQSVEISQSVLGVQFKNVERNWIHDDIFRYDAHVVTKAFQFGLELNVHMKVQSKWLWGTSLPNALVGHENCNQFMATGRFLMTSKFMHKPGNFCPSDFLSICQQDDEKYQIEDINCHFINLDKCFLGEIAPWTLRFTREKDFAYLMFAVSEYSEISVTRAKILGTLEANQYVSMEMCNEEGGGILVYVHPPSDDDKILFKFQWYTGFVDRTWHVEHIFAIETIQADENFIEANKDLLEGFCRTGLGKTDLEKLWSDLCTAIDTLR